MKSELICGNSLDEIKNIQSNQFDLIILDPDYQDWAKICDTDFFSEVFRTLKTTGNVLCFTKQPFDQQLRNHVDTWFRREFIWSFTNGGAWVSNRMPLVSYQKIYWLTKTKDFYINVRTGIDYPETTKSFKRSKKQFGGWAAEGRQFEKSDQGTWVRDHYHFNKPHTGAVPSKPFELMRILLNCFTPENGYVFDPFFGSGVTGDVAEKIGRNILGIEINPERFDSVVRNAECKGGK
jgi:DNA modification methylase